VNLLADMCGWVVMKNAHLFPAAVVEHAPARHLAGAVGLDANTTAGSNLILS